MDKLKEYANKYFEDYNEEGSRKAIILEEIEDLESNSLKIQYEYTALHGQKKILIKTFSYDENNNIVHSGPISK